jgi:hypothetical protein
MTRLEDKLDLIEHDWKAQDRRVRFVYHVYLRCWLLTWTLHIGALRTSSTLQLNTLSKNSLNLALS